MMLLPILIPKALICTTRQKQKDSGTSSKMMSLAIGLVFKQNSATLMFEKSIALNR